MSNTEKSASHTIKSSLINTSGKTDAITVGCVIMASGIGKRFGGNKLMANLGGKPMIKWILDTTDGLFCRRVVVTRSAEVKAICDEMNIDVILHTKPGRNDTVRLGLEQMAADVDYCFFMPSDQPFITRATFEKMLLAIREDKVHMIWRAAYGDRVGAPVAFPKWTYEELLALPEGKGGSEVVKRYLEKVKTIQVEDGFELEDIDTKEDLIKAEGYIIKKNKSFVLPFENMNL